MPSALTVLLVGGPTAVLDYAGLRLLTDPTFDPPGEHEGGLTKLDRARAWPPTTSARSTRSCSRTTTTPTTSTPAAAPSCRAPGAR